MLIGNRNGWLGFDGQRNIQRSNQGSTWTPASLGANLKGWWKADAGVRARTAAQFTGANSESLSITDAAMNPSLDMGDVDFWFAGKVYMDSVAAGFDTFFGKGNINGPYALYRNAAALKFVVGDGVTPVQPQVTGLSAATWYHFMGYYDSVNDLVGISIDGAAFVTAAQVGGTNVNASDFSVGADLNGVGFLDGRVQELACGKSPPGGIAAIADTIRDAFYNGGAGLAVADVTTTQRTAWGGLSAWPMHENSGTRADIWGSNTLTDNNTVTANDGKVDYAAADGDAVCEWEDQSGNAYDLVQATHANKPIYETNIINGKPVIRFDGAGDHLAKGTTSLVTQANSMWMVVDDNDAAARVYFDGDAASKQLLRHDGTNLEINAGSDVGAAHTAGDPHFVQGDFNGASSEVWVDGVSLATGDAGAQEQDAGFTVGADNAGANSLAGDIAEVIANDAVFTAGERAELAAYAASRYGL